MPPLSEPIGSHERRYSSTPAWEHCADQSGNRCRDSCGPHDSIFGQAWLGVQLRENAPDFLRQDAYALATVLLVLALMFVLLMRWNEERRQLGTG